MNSSDMVMIQAATTYLEGAVVKHERSAPYAVSRSHGLELQAQGFATIIEAEPEAPPAPPAPPVDPESPVALTAPRRRGRPPKAR